VAELAIPPTVAERHGKWRFRSVSIMPREKSFHVFEGRGDERKKLSQPFVFGNRVLFLEL
jgi:hypothetical protein